MLERKVEWNNITPDAQLMDSQPDAQTQFFADFLANAGSSVSAYLPDWKQINTVDQTVSMPWNPDPKGGLQYEESGNGLTDNGGIFSTLQPIDLTDKQSDVYGKQPLVRSDSIVAQLLSFKTSDANSFVNDANQTALNDPAAAGLETYAVADSPLQANLGQQSAFLSGTDPMPVTPDQQTQTEEATKPSDCGTFDFACKWGTIDKEIYFFIVGAIVLSIGIYAATR